jgi:hypothetical protein
MEVSGQFHAPAALPSGKQDPGTHWTRGCVGPRTGLDAMEKGKTSSHYRGIEPRPSTSATTPTELYVTENRMYCRELVDKAASQRRNRGLESLLDDADAFLCCPVLPLLQSVQP